MNYLIWHECCWNHLVGSAQGKEKKSRNNAARKRYIINSEMFYGLALERDLAGRCTGMEKSVYV